VACTTESKTTRLSEAQARALADWWGGSLEQISSPGQAGETFFGVVFPSWGQEDQTIPHSQKTAIFSLEEARFLENLRDGNNPNAPDWVG